MKFTKNMYKTVIILMLILIMPTVICDVVIPDIYQDDYWEPPYDEPAEDNTPNDALPEDIPADGDTPNDKPSDDVPPEDSTPNDKPADDVPSDVEKPTDTPSDDDFSEDETPDDETPTDKPSDDVPPNDDIPPEDDSEEIEPEDIDFLNPEYTITGLPEFVSNISECKNKKKKYVLPDGYLYSYDPYFVPYATNMLTSATDTDGSIYNETGYRDGARIRGVRIIAEYAYSFVTGFMAIKPGDIIYFSGNCFDPSFKDSNVLNILFYDSSKQVISQTTLHSATEKAFEVIEFNSDGYISAIRVNKEEFPEELSYVRFTLVGSGGDQIISVNESLEKGYERYAWHKTEKYLAVPLYQEVEKTIDTIKNLELSEESSIIKFMFASDIHVGPETMVSYTENLGKVCAEVMRSCKIPFFVTGGDNTGGMTDEWDLNLFAGRISRLLEQLSPIPKKNVLAAIGNHDGAMGACEQGGRTVYYRFQLNNEQRSEVFFCWQRETNKNKIFDSDGTYYFIDDATTKCRFIFLNPFWSEWAGNEDGFAYDIEHSFFHTPIFGSQQLNWFANEALDMPSGYGAILIAHFAPSAKDFAVFKGIVDAFNNKSLYSGSYIGVKDWQSTHMSVNYQNVNSEIIAIFQGHNHIDTQYDYFESIPCINITSACGDSREENPIKRVKGTATEVAADAVIIDRDKRKIYMIRLGAGDDRVIDY